MYFCMLDAVTEYVLRDTNVQGLFSILTNLAQETWCAEF